MFCIFPEIVLETVATYSFKQSIFIVQVDAYHPISTFITSCITQSVEREKQFECLSVEISMS